MTSRVRMGVVSGASAVAKTPYRIASRETKQFYRRAETSQEEVHSTGCVVFEFDRRVIVIIDDMLVTRR